MTIQVYCGENIGFRFCCLPRHLNVRVTPKMIFLSKKDCGVRIDDYIKDGGPGEVRRLCSFYHEPFRT